MRNTLLLVVLIFSIKVSAQDTTKTVAVKGRGGFETEVTLNFNPDEISRLNFWAGFNVGVDKMSFGGVSYYSPKKHLANLHIGDGVSYDGVFFVNNWLKPKIIRNNIPIGPGVGYSMLNVANKRYSFGFHYGAGRYRYFQSMTANHAVFGLTILKAIGGNLSVKMNGETRKGFTRVTYNLDFIRYFGHNYPVPSYITIVEPGQATGFNTYTQEQYDSTNESGKVNYGVKISLEGYSALWTRKGNVGFRYFFGFGFPPDLGTGGADLGLGLSFSFL
jgi:hypothetical protein